MALSAKERKKLLKTGSSERAKKHAASGVDFSYFNNELLKKYGLEFARPKAREDAYYFNVIPYIDSKDEDSYVLVTKVHRLNVNGIEKNVICPKAMFPGKNLPCPACDKRIDIMTNDPENKDAIDKLKVKEREVYYVEDISNQKEKEKGIQLFDVAATFFGWKIKPLMKPKVGGVGVKSNRGYIDISDFEKGKTVSFTVGTKTVPGIPNPIPDYTGHSLEDRDPIDEDVIDKAVELPPLESLIHVYSEAEIYEFVNNEKEDKGEGEEEREARSESSPEDNKSSLKKRLDKKKKEKEKKKEKKVDLDFDYKGSDSDDLEIFIEENEIEIDEDDLGNKTKMKIAIRKFLKKQKEIAEEGDCSGWPDKDDISDIDGFIDDNSDNLKEFCDHHGIEYEEEDNDEYEYAIQEWYVSE